MAIQNSLKPEGIISAGDSFPIKLIDANVSKYLKGELTGSVFEHLAVARDLDIKKHRLFIAVTPITALGSFKFDDTLFLGKAFADGEVCPDGVDILLKRHELGIAAYWDNNLERLYNRVIEYKGLFFDADTLNNLATGRDVDVERYISIVKMNPNLNAVTRWLGA